MKTPTFEEFLGNKKVFHPELKGQYQYLWSRYQDKIKSCFSSKSCSVFDATTETNPSKVSWTNNFICPFTKKAMKIVQPIYGDNYWSPVEED
tara:strand:- start:1557 stop:1832 length:276 start_codon:yes stop_codon:yes gene_type:complete